MKINDATSGLSSMVISGSPDGAAEPTGPAAARISLAETSRLADAAHAGIEMAASERASRIHHLTQVVRAGAYRPSASQLADQLLSEADFDHHLAEALR